MIISVKVQVLVLELFFVMFSRLRKERRSWRRNGRRWLLLLPCWMGGTRMGQCRILFLRLLSGGFPSIIICNYEFASYEMDSFTPRHPA